MPSILRPRRLPRRQTLGLSGALLALVAAGAVVLLGTGNHPPFAGLDGGWNALVLASRTPELTGLNMALNFAGNMGMTLYAIGLCALLLRRHRRLALYTAGVNLGALALTHLIKFVVSRPRPDNRLVSVDTGSYPSGHVSATAAAVVCTALLLWRAWVWVSGSVLVVAMMWSRTYLGAHWLSDTVAGALLGAGLALLLWGLFQDKCLPRHIDVPVDRALPAVPGVGEAG